MARSTGFKYIRVSKLVMQALTPIKDAEARLAPWTKYIDDILLRYAQAKSHPFKESQDASPDKFPLIEPSHKPNRAATKQSSTAGKKTG